MTYVRSDAGDTWKMRFHPELASFVNVPGALLISVVYVLAGLAGNAMMKSRTAMELTQLKLVYNVTQIAACSVIFYRLLPFFTVCRTLQSMVFRGWKLGVS